MPPLPELALVDPLAPPVPLLVVLAVLDPPEPPAPPDAAELLAEVPPEPTVLETLELLVDAPPLPFGPELELHAPRTSAATLPIQISLVAFINRFLS